MLARYTKCCSFYCTKTIKVFSITIYLIVFCLLISKKNYYVHKSFEKSNQVHVSVKNNIIESRPLLKPLSFIKGMNLNITKQTRKQNDIFYISENKVAEIYNSLKPCRHQQWISKKQNVAIIVPFRNRESHLNIFIRHMHYFLNQQHMNYGIFIVEQIANQTFNRGKLMNVGFLEAVKDGPWNCFFFHDVDLLPLTSLNKYKCDYLPKHFSAAIDIFNYSVPYSGNFGGVTAMSRYFFERLNGFSNIFWGWGGEDDELRKRVFAVGVVFYRIPTDIGRYKMIGHKRDAGNEAPPLKCRLNLIKRTGTRFNNDGLNGIKYSLIKKEKTFLYTHFLVDLMEQESIKSSKFKCDN